MASTEFPVSRLIRTAMMFGGILFLVSCGSEAPTFEPGNIEVTSSPAGAEVFVDNLTTGSLTPTILEDLTPDLYLISVKMADFVSNPEVIPVDLKPLGNPKVVFSLSQTGFRVESPAGARILVDGLDTGKFVPASVAGLDPGTVAVSLELDGYLVNPAELPVVITEGEITLIPGDAFSSRSKKTVIMEGFANISCIPCPQLTDNFLALTAQPGLGPDRVLFMEFAVSWPELGDPFFLSNPSENADRFNGYQVLGAPDLYVDGIGQANALDAAAMETAVRAALEAEPGFLVDITADFSSSSVPVTVTLDPYQDVDLTGYMLFVAIYETEIEIDPAPGLNGQTVFHHVFRDRVDTPPDLGVLTAGSPQQFILTLAVGDPGPDRYVALALVQHAVDLSVLQTGSTVATAKAAAERDFSTSGLKPVPSPERNSR